MNRWTNITLVKPRALDAAHAHAATKTNVNNYVYQINTVLTKPNLTNKPESIFNIDENGINMNHKPNNIVAARDSQAATSGRSSTITIITGRNVLGTNIPPFYVFPGQRMRDEFLVDRTPGTDGTVSDSGWSNTEIFMKYMK